MQGYRKKLIYRRKKSSTQSIWDFFALPLRTVVLDEKMQKRLRLTTIKEERVRFILPLLEGKTLDIGCGRNELIQEYRKAGEKGFGVDVFPFEEVDQIIDTTTLPFEDGEFDTVTLIACFNHIPRKKRDRVLSEAHRVLRNQGRLLLTMISGFSGWFCHKLCWWEFDQKERGINESEEDYGLSDKYLTETLNRNGFNIIHRKRFGYLLNNLFVFRKDGY